MRRLATGLLALAVMLGATPAEAKIWRYVDQNGGVHYTTDVNELPAKMRAKILAERLSRPDAAPPTPAPPPSADADAGAAPTGQRILFNDPKAAAPEAAPPPPAAGPNEDARRQRWQIQIREAREKAADARHTYSVAEMEANKANRAALLVPTGQAYERRRLAQEELARAAGVLEDARAAESDLRERAEREDVPADWLQ